MDAFGPNGETIMDYSLYDAQRAGFDHVVFIIRQHFADAFKEVFGPKLKGRMKVDYVLQELDIIPEPYPIPLDREKPWGTGHAVWVAHKAVKGPFGVINADDYYGPESYKTLYSFLSSPRTPEEYCVVGYRLANTLSAYGAVNRGICAVDAHGYLLGMEECKGIRRDNDGRIMYPGPDGSERILSEDAPVSMNMFGFYPSYFPYFEQLFRLFLQDYGQDLTSEYYIPTLVDYLIQTGKLRTRVLDCQAEWFGVTYREDKEEVSQRLHRLISEGIYPKRLWD